MFTKKTFSLTLDALTADVEAVLAADLKDDALLGLAVQSGVPAVAVLVRWGGHRRSSTSC